MQRFSSFYLKYIYIPYFIFLGLFCSSSHDPVLLYLDRDWLLFLQHLNPLVSHLYSLGLLRCVNEEIDLEDLPLDLFVGLCKLFLARLSWSLLAETLWETNCLTFSELLFWLFLRLAAFIHLNLSGVGLRLRVIMGGRAIFLIFGTDFEESW